MAVRAIVLPPYARIVGIGLIAGLFSSLFGVGGGIVAVPLLMMTGVPARQATGTSLAAIVITATVGAVLYSIEGHVDYAHAALVGLPAVAGVLAGTALQQRIPTRKLVYGFAALLTGLGIWLLVTGSTDAAAGSTDPDVAKMAIAVVAGIAAGILAGLFGVGGGILFVPALVGLGLGQLAAEATSLLAVIPTVAVGAYRQHGYGNVQVRTAGILGVSSVAGVYVGVLIATATDEGALRKLFAALLLATAVQLALRTRSRKD